MKNEIKNIDIELNKLKNDKYKLDELIRTNDIIIKNYDEKKARFLKLFDEKEVYANYMILVNKNGLPLHILKRYLTHKSDGINFISESFIKAPNLLKLNKCFKQNLERMGSFGIILGNREFSRLSLVHLQAVIEYVSAQF
jgi:hypothetical protein